MYVEGRLRTRKWDDTAGVTRYSTEVVVDNFIFLDSKYSTNDSEAPTPPSPAVDPVASAEGADF